MGSCASVHKFPKKLFLGSPHKAQAVNGKGGGGGVAPVGDGCDDLKCSKVQGEQRQAGFDSKSPDSGSKDEMFFESRAWLDSDCEDDFYSVNGDFTPSRGSTPIYQPRTTPTVMSKVFLPDTKSPVAPSPTGRRKLIELLQEAVQTANDESSEDVSKNEKEQLQPAAAAEKPLSESSSACSTEQTPTTAAKAGKEKAWYTGRCCLPSFVHSLDLDESERRQKMSSGPCAV